MDWLNHFIIPLITTIIIFSFVAVLMFFGYRSMKILWSRWLSHFLKYRVLGMKPGIKMDAIKELQKMSDSHIKQELLLRGFTNIKINELLYLKNLGGKNDRSVKKHDR